MTTTWFALMVGAVLLVGGLGSMAVGVSGFYDRNLTRQANRAVFGLSLVASLVGSFLFWAALISLLLR